MITIALSYLVAEIYHHNERMLSPKMLSSDYRVTKFESISFDIFEVMLHSIIKIITLITHGSIGNTEVYGLVCRTI